MNAGRKGKMWEFNVQDKKEILINIITSLPDLEIPFTNSWNSTRNGFSVEDIFFKSVVVFVKATSSFL